MILMIAAANTAFALDCTNRNAESCAAANSLRDQVNTHAGTTVVQETGGNARFRTLHIYNQIEGLRSSLAANGCEIGGVTIEGTIGGTFGQTTPGAGNWAGRWADTGGAPSGTASGSFGNLQWTGSYGPTLGDVGDVFAAYTLANVGQIAGNRDDGYLGGIWVRGNGTLPGYFATAYGSCTRSEANALDIWYAGDLVQLPIDGTITARSGTGTGSLIGNDLTHPSGPMVENVSDPNWGFIDIFSNNEPGFGGGEFAFNVFDDQVGSGNAKWCCAAPSLANPLFVGVEFAGPIELTDFTIASSNDTPGRDPRVWNIEGSNDGVNWDPIFVQDDSSASLWSSLVPANPRNKVLHVVLDQPSPPYTHFRYRVFLTGIASGNAHALNELEFFGTEL